MTKFMVQQEIFSRLGNLVTFPSDKLEKRKKQRKTELSKRFPVSGLFRLVSAHFGFERLYDGSSAASTIDQNQSQAS